MASFGENLRRERELRGVSLREIAEATKISVRFLQALEQDRVEILPGGLFPRAFVRQYARYLGLDAERYVAEFLYVHGRFAPDRPPASRAASRPPLGLSKGLLLFAAALVAAVALTLRSTRGERPAPAAARNPARSSAPAFPADRVYPAPPPPSSAAAEPEGLVLTLTAQQSCWVQAQADGQVVIDRVLSQGESQTFEARGEIVLSVGNAGGLAFTVNDRPGVSLGKSGEVKRNIVITRDNLPSLVQDRPTGRGSHSS
jgi:cytoskeletal protein RodZ